jgi:adenylate cyclase
MASGPNSTIQFTIDQVRSLALLCVRFETLTASRVFHALPERKGSAPGLVEDTQQNESPLHFSCNPKVLLPTLEKASEGELLGVLGALTIRLENAVKALQLQHLTRRGIFGDGGGLSHALTSAGLDERTLDKILAVLDDS